MKNIHLLLAKPARKQKADGSRFWAIRLCRKGIHIRHIPTVAEYPVRTLSFVR